MPDKSPIQKLQDAVLETVSIVVADPKAAATKAIEQVRGAVSLGLTLAGAVAGEVASRLSGVDEPTPDRSEAPPRPHLRVADEAPETDVVPTPKDVARAVAKKAPPPKRAAPSTPSGKLPAKKTPAKKTPAKKTPAKKTPAKKAPVKKAPAKKAPPGTA